LHFEASPGKQFRETLSQKKTHHKKRTGGVAEGESPEFKPQYCKKKKNKNKNKTKPKQNKNTTKMPCSKCLAQEFIYLPNKSPCSISIKTFS
jgi:hypothetical protein